MSVDGESGLRPDQRRRQPQAWSCSRSSLSGPSAFNPPLRFAFRLTGALHMTHGSAGDPTATQPGCLPESRKWGKKTNQELKLLRSCLQCSQRGAWQQPLLPPILAVHTSRASSSASKADPVSRVQGEQVISQQRSLLDAELISVPEKATCLFL